MKEAVVLFSGGLDSTTCLAMAKAHGFACYALSFSYGQKHDAELNAAVVLAKEIGAAEHRIVNLDIGQFGGSALTDNNINVPDFKQSTDIPVTYVPARNTVFLATALSYAESLGAADIYIGVNAIDYSNYPDCRPDFIKAFQDLANIATKAGVQGQHLTIHTPLMHMTKGEIIAAGNKLAVDYGKTVSCYNLDQNGAACGTCDSCVLRARGFEDAAILDPTVYQ
jgi:7-cyano-7-deazaguanine synthase